MARSRAKWVAVGAPALLLWACTGTIEAPENSRSGGPGVGKPWVPGTGINGPGGAGIAGSSSLPGSSSNAPGGVKPNGNGGSAAPGSGNNPVTSPLEPLKCVTPAVGPSPLRRLTHAEYDNAVADLLGDTTHPGREFAADTQIGLFDNSADAQTVPELLADQYLATAVTLAERITDAKTFAGCDPASGATCVKSFVGNFGRRAYRRPLTTEESDSLVKLYNDTSAASDAVTGVRAVVSATLVSPEFLFRPEFGDKASTLPNAKVLSPFEIASRLASLIWASVPDDVLLDAAQNGQLATRDQVATQARRMLGDDRSHAPVRAFYEQWFGLPLLDSATKDATVYPQFNDALRASMAEETRRFIDYVLWQDDAKLATLFTAPYSFVNQPLGKLYGVTGGKDEATYTRTTLDAKQRLGVLSQASLMTTFANPQGSSPIKRGKLVRVRLLCQDLPDPPANVPPPPPPKQGVSTRERFAMHTSSAACSGCHHLIDGLGFGLEHYDGVGAYRTMDQGVAVDASGEINTTLDIDGNYSGGPELSGLLAKSEQVRDCAPTQWLRYALARRETEADTCSIVSLREAFAKSGGDLRELMVALTQTDAFWNYRQPE